jgi:hypothetical protein
MTGHISETISNLVAAELKAPYGLGAYITIDEENPLDPSTPQGTPMKIGGWGINRRCIDYPTAIGFRQISDTEDDPYYILSGRDKVHVVRTSIAHTRLFTLHSVRLAIEDAAWDIEDAIDRRACDEDEY